MSRGEVDPLRDGRIADLFRLHADDLRRFALGVLRDAGLAEDVVQVCFAKFAERALQPDDDGARAWLFKVAYNESITLLRRRKVQSNALNQMAWLSQGSEASEDAPSKIDRHEQIQNVREAIERLPAVEKQVVCLRVYEQLKFREIADQLNIPLGTALSRMRTALQKLAAHLADGPENEA